MLNKINPYLIENKAIPEQQYAYPKNISIFHQHIDIQKIIYQGLNDQDIQFIDLIFFDLSNAFDTLNFDKLIEILKNCGIVENI